MTSGSRLPCRKSVLNTKTLGTSVPLNLVLSPVPIRRSRAFLYCFGSKLVCQFLQTFLDLLKIRFELLVYFLNKMKWKVPPRIKIHEALGAIGDKRIEVSGDTAKIYSSSGGKFYTVTYDATAHALMVNDNGSYWKGYLGYPAIAYLMMIGKIYYTQEQTTAFVGIAWKDINTKFKNDFDKTLTYIHNAQEERGIDVVGLEKEIDLIFTHVSNNLPSMLGKKTKPPGGY